MIMSTSIELVRQCPMLLKPTWGLVSSLLTMHFAVGVGCVGCDMLAKLNIIEKCLKVC